MKHKIITIDGPAGSGKARIASYIAKKWKYYHLDSGILYRRLAYLILKNNIKLSDKKQIEKFLAKTNTISPRNSIKLRTEKISKAASKIAIYIKIRNYINIQQKNIIKKELKNRGCVIDGRDIGSVVFKKANIKIFVIVNAKIRAKRRYKQLIDIGEKSIYAKILEEIKLRDNKDKKRKNSPMKVPYKAHIIDNSESFSNTIFQINKIIQKNS